MTSARQIPVDPNQPNPVAIINGASSRLAIVAATGPLIHGLAPALTAVVLAAALPAINHLTGARFAHELTPAALIDLRLAMVVGAVVALALGAGWAAIAWRRARDYVSAAERVDTIVNARQEILTLATLTDVSNSSPSGANRPALFPILWRRACVYLANFSPERAFRFEVGRPLMRGSALSLAVVAVLALAMMGLARPPSPEALQARTLKDMASAIEASSPDESGRALAKALRDTASALENPKLPPEQKLKMLADLTSEIHRSDPHVNPSNQAQSVKSHGNSGNGNSGGKGNSGNGEGTGSGQGKGAGGNNAEAKGSGTGKKNDQQMAALEKELSQAKERIESDSAQGDKSKPKPSAGGNNGKALAPGDNPHQPGSANRPDASARNEHPKSGANAPSTDKSGEGGQKLADQDRGSTQGDTRLGQFPAPLRYERFYKPGEHGPPIEIKDARYVMFRLPSGAASNGGGKTVPDTERPEASTPYSNAPLKPERLDATPDERQLVPPRYRDLIQ